MKRRIAALALTALLVLGLTACGGGKPDSKTIKVGATPAPHAAILEVAKEILAEQGYGLLIWDAFRPVSAQFRLWEVCPDPVYVANPERGYSSHSRGNTVDLTLVTLEGEAVEMPTGFDDFTPLADRDYSDIPEPAATHARLLEEVMTSCGFRPYQGEWWHFSDTDPYPVEENFQPETEEEEEPANADYGH